MCLNPRTIVLKNGVRMQVACGHCSQCFKAYQDQWTARFNEEVKCWKRIDQGRYSLPPVVFFTLKYRNDSIACSYLVLTDSGWHVTTKRPSCEVLQFWTDTRRENRSQWLSRRRDMLEKYWRVYAAVSRSLARAEYVAATFPQGYVGNDLAYQRALLCMESLFGALPDDCLPDTVPFYSFEGSIVEHPDYGSMSVPYSSEGAPILALEFHTFDKKSVTDWLKRCRSRFVRAVGKVGRSRMISTWTDSEGVQHELPSCALTDTFKYFITSEYGPLTHRPHLHGCLFGVTYDEFEQYFAADWMESFGSVEFSALRPTGGALTYLSKYCSKGHYEHPYACRDFIYPSGKEYHSDSFEQSIADFNVDCNLVSPTFHLVSKGIGCCYAFQNEVLEYFGAALCEYHTDAGSRKYSCADLAGSVQVGHRPSFELNQVFVCSPELRSLSKSLDLDECLDGSLRVRKYDVNGHLTGESFIPAAAVVDRTVENLLLNHKYTRTYVKSQNSRTASCGLTLPRWHFVGLPGLGGCQTCTTSISLPRYYRQWLVSPLASGLLSCAARRLHTDVDAQVRELLRQGRPLDEVMAWRQSVLASDEARNKDLGARLRDRARRDYLPSGVYELD